MMKREEVLQRALTLPVDERLELVDHLLQSLHGEPDPKEEAQWAEEAEALLLAVREGREGTVSGTEVVARLSVKYADAVQTGTPR